MKLEILFEGREEASKHHFLRGIVEDALKNQPFGTFFKLFKEWSTAYDKIMAGDKNAKTEFELLDRKFRNNQWETSWRDNAFRFKRIKTYKGIPFYTDAYVTLDVDFDQLATNRLKANATLVLTCNKPDGGGIEIPHQIKQTFSDDPATISTNIKGLIKKFYNQCDDILIGAEKGNPYKSILKPGDIIGEPEPDDPADWWKN